MSESLSVWTVFNDKTKDFPGVFVCRRFESYGEPEPHVVPCEVVATGSSLEEIREQLPAGLCCLARQEHDDPNIIETWL